MTIVDQAFLRAYGRRAESRSTDREPRAAAPSYRNAAPNAARTNRPAHRPIVLDPSEDQQPLDFDLDPAATEAAELVRSRVMEMQAERSAHAAAPPQRHEQPSGVDLSDTMNLISNRQKELRSTPQRTERPQPKPPQSKPAPAPISAKRPLSSYTSRPPVQEPKQESHGLATARFHWPRLCLELALDHRYAFENVVEGLLKWKLHGRSVIGIAGCYAGQGCTTFTLCLAKVLADMGKPTAIVEANFSTPSLAEQLDVYPAASWQDVLWRGVPVGEALMISVTEPVAMLPLNPNDIREPNGEIANEAFTTSRVLQNNYDFVLVDLGPMLAPEHQSIALEMAAALAAQGALIVSDSSMSMPGDPEVVGRLLTQVGCDPIGIVETFAERHAA